MTASYAGTLERAPIPGAIAGSAAPDLAAKREQSRSLGVTIVERSPGAPMR